MKNRLKSLAFVAGLLVSSVAFSQNKVTGYVFDASKKAALSEVEVYVNGSSDPITTNADGSFTLTTDLNKGKIDFLNFGYYTKTVNFDFKQANEINLGTIYLDDNSEDLSEIVIIAQGVIDVAEGRKTPIAVSTISKREIEEKVGGQDITSTLVNTPSVYVTSQVKGFGESSMTTRGFDQSNTAFLLNGQPINGMDNGSVYWSNWSGMTDIANAVQIQRGLGSSKLAISSVGGTINFVTKATDMKQGGFIKGIVGNDNFYKTTVGYNTGLLENGFGVSAMFTHWQGDGYMNGTAGAGQNYFLSFGYKVNEKHNLNLLITGAPQWHNQGTNAVLSDFEKFGRRYNANLGTWNGEEFNGRKNFYHKPVANFNWDWKIDEKSNLSTVVYASVAKGGGQSPRYSVERNTETGLLKYDTVFDINQQQADGVAKNWLGADMNNHEWYGIVSNYNRQINDNFSFNAGFDVRTYKGSHHRQVANLFGAQFVKDSGNVNLGDVFISDEFSSNPWKTFSNQPENANQKYGWEYDQSISYGGVFGQLEYAKDNFTAFVQGALSQQYNSRRDTYQYTPGNEESEKVSNVGYNIKGGASYILADQHMFFANAGVYSRQPYQNNIFMNYKNDVFENAVNEDIVGLELGYKFTSRYVDVNINAYKTTWANRVKGSSELIVDEEGLTKYNKTNDPSLLNIGEYVYRSDYGTKQDHQGLELDVVARPFYGFELKGFASVGNWVYKGSANSIYRNEARVILREDVKDVDGGKVGNAAQTVLGLGFRYKITNALSIDADYRYYDDLYSSIQEKDNLQLPSYQLVDAGVSYSLQLTDKNKMSFRVNVNNLFDTEYISEMSTAKHISDKTTSTYKGIDASNQGLIGLGRTWNASIKFTF